MSIKAGSKCPIVGLAMAFRILGWTSEGPGPISVLVGGINDCIFFCEKIKIGTHYNVFSSNYYLRNLISRK